MSFELVKQISGQRAEIERLMRGIGLAFLGFILFIIVTGFILRKWMALLEGSLFYPALAAIASLVLLLALYVNARKHNLRGIRYLISFAFFIFVFNFLQIFSWDVAVAHSPFKRPLGTVLLNIADLCIPLVTISLYLHFTSIEETRGQSRSAAFVGLTTFPSIVLSILVIIFQDEAINDSLIWVLAILAIGILYITGYGLRIMTRIYLKTMDKEIKTGAITMIISIFYMTLAFTTQVLTPDDINFGLFRAEIFQLLLLAIATSLLTYTYIRNPLFIYAIPFNIYEMIIYDNDGNMIWAHSFVPSLIEMEAQALKTRGLNAIGEILREVSGFQGDVQSIKLTDGNLSLEKHLDNFMVIISETRSEQIVEASRNFLSEFHMIGDDEDRRIELLKKYFPFS